ncbi:MAG: phosphopantothenoylcysteine decarboxylase domain-containing protein [Planctomycetota bacterium]|jgi:phosphopantothenoylcysteine decarboxylase/phosphopantothenate--cysteine ligase
MHFLITAGPTREYIDPVRFISNASSGRMGYALAAAAVKTGHKVTLISGPVNLPKPTGTKVVSVGSSKEMFAAVKKYFDRCDCLVMAAAVSDYRIDRVAKTKIKKTDQVLTLRLKPTADILKWAGGHKGEKLVVGFALEDKAIRRGAEKKLKEKNLDMIVANTPAAIDAEKSTVQIKTTDSKWVNICHTAKTTLAKKIIAMIEKM